MLRWARSISLAVFILTLTIAVASHKSVSSDGDSCSALFSQSAVSPDSQTNLNWQINNNGIDPIAWMKITSPGGDFTVIGASSRDWTVGNDNANVVYSGSSIDGGISYNQLYVAVQAGSNQTLPEAWSVQASIDPNGSNPFTCADYGLEVAVSTGVGPVISNVTATSLSNTSENISWTTDNSSTSEVDYGLDDQYGNSTQTDSNLVTSHSVDLIGLTSNTAYHFQLTSNDIAQNSTTSSDNTFLTSSDENGSGSGSNGNGSNNNNGSGGNSDINLFSSVDVKLSGKRTESVPPTIQLSTKLSKYYKVTPTFNGVAGDNVAVAAVEYSTDGGKDWLPADSSTGLGTSKVTFSFTPLNLEDGDYEIVARAIDTSGNVSATQPEKLILDRINPYVGGNMLSLGPEVLEPDNSGDITTTVGINQKITLSAVGGPTSITLVAESIGKGRHTTQDFSLTQSEGTGLWAGIASFKVPGKYVIVSNAVDGAGIKISQVLDTVNVLNPAHTYVKSTKNPVISTVTLYYLDPDSGSWVVWDGSSYGQENPQKTDKNGSFILFMPPGKYYLKATAAGYESSISSIFVISKSEPFSTNLAMKPLFGLSLGPLHLSLPSWAIQNIDLNHQTNKGLNQNNVLIGHSLPVFTLQDTNGATIHTADLLGKPTLITIGSTWSPIMSEQIAILSKLQANQDINIVPIALQEDAGKVSAYSNISGLNLNWLVDPNSTLSSNFGSPNLPTHYFVDRNGIVRDVYTGVLNQTQINSILSGL